MEHPTYHDFMLRHLPELSPKAGFSIGIAFLLASKTYSLLRFCQPTHHPHEPAVIPQRTPYIGHILGIIRHGLGYYHFIHNHFRLPIFTLHFMSSKVYVVTSLEVAKATQKYKTLSFSPFVTAWLPPLYGIDANAIKIMERNMNYKEGKFGYMHDAYGVLHDMLSPGQETLNKLTISALNEFADIVNSTHSVSDDLYDWVRHVYTAFTMKAAWGHRNPFTTCSTTEKDFWFFEEKFHFLLLDVLPKWTSLGGYDAREKITSAFCDYHSGHIPADASDLIREWAAVSRRYGLSTETLARLDVGLAQAMVLNTVPASVWMLLHIFSSQPLLDEVRSEVEPLFNNGKFDPDTIRSCCPALNSTWHEVLRFTSYLPQGRTVLEDTMLQDRYLLTKGATVVVPQGIIHADTDVWGPDAAIFDPHRFMPDRKKVPSGAFRGFGGGSFMCPGRHFAATEVLTFVATMATGFEIVPTDGKPLTVPDRDTFSPSLSLLKPIIGREVRIERRKGWDNVLWSFSKDDVLASEEKNMMRLGR